jgi:hypothetical protein
MDNNTKWKTFTINDKSRIKIQVHVPAGTYVQMALHFQHLMSILNTTVKNHEKSENEQYTLWLKK